MNATSHTVLQQADALAARVATACARIAPTWPLDQFIAVNPFLGWTALPMDRAAATLGVLCGTRLTMPRDWYRTQRCNGRIQPEVLRDALAREGHDIAGDKLPDAGDAPPHPLPLVTDLRDASDHLPHGMHWSELVTHQVSQYCAAFFDADQARWRPNGSDGLYAGWRRQLAADRGLAWRQGRRWLVSRLQALPDDAHTLIGDALAALRMPEAAQTHYLTALLLSINGWAAWCAYLRWQARLHGNDDDHLQQLLAVRLAWEWLLVEDAPQRLALADWTDRWSRAEAMAASRAEACQIDWTLQAALEQSYQQRLGRQLLAAAAPNDGNDMPAVQAVFCIDVRSEPLRRALEQVTPLVHTRGFAGFFGLPMAYAAAGSDLVRPRLPGLLAPSQQASEDAAAPSLAQAWRRRRQAALRWRQRWAELRGAPASAFSFVESCGLLYGAKLWMDSLPSDAAPSRWEETGLPRSACGARPRLQLADQDPGAAAALAHGVLKAMGLTQGFAPLVLLVGHGSQSANNAHAAGLDCGACGGQSGEVNARALADLLNDSAVRQALLAQHGIALPPQTHFLPALHNTTTDEVSLFDTQALPAAREPEVASLRHWLAQAAHRTRCERAGLLGLDHLRQEPEALCQALRQRANDWAQVRPEWGLAGNAAFIAAPRARTRHLDLQGRGFLHDYDWRADTDNATLELVMTAPMVVASWINLQYYASTVDNHRWGSGNKTLHNVVGGRIGVFEGNGGDLRIGLPLQSLHDGREVRHTPQRLSVFIEAPQERIDAVLARHEGVRHLVCNGWLHLLCVDPHRPHIAQWLDGQWRTVCAAT